MLWKSKLAMELAKRWMARLFLLIPCKFIKEWILGRLKPTQEDRLLIPHHLIDIRTIQENFNVVDFYFDARQACQQILERGNVPIVAGGSGFYLHALLYGPPSGPPSIPEVRKELEEEMEKARFGRHVLQA